jgi:uncharacterized protein (TIGR02145 family)
MKHKTLTNLLMIIAAMVITTSCEKDELGSDSGSQYGTFTDPRDGEVYQTVKIGEQIWMAENLRTTKYNDGTDIPLVTDNSAWLRNDPAYCWYNNDEATYKDTYGALYNWKVVETGKLAPKGWHVPTENEWSKLEAYLGANGYNYDGTTDTWGAKLGKSLASQSIWQSSTEIGDVGNDLSTNNSSGFNGLPSGRRLSISGEFVGDSTECFWWSSTEAAYGAYFRGLYDTHSFVYSNDGDRRNGYSVRCIKD